MASRTPADPVARRQRCGEDQGVMPADTDVSAIPK